MQKQSGKLSILIVSNDANLRSTIASYLNRYNVVETDTVYAASDMLSKANFHILIANMFAPQRNVVKLIIKSKEAYPNLIPILITGNGTLKPTGEVEKRSLISFIEKPFTAEQLDMLIQKRIKDLHDQIQPLSVFDVVLLYCLSNENLALTLVQETALGKDQGNIYFEKGRITNAVFGRVVGEEAFFYLLTWVNVTYIERKNIVTKRKDISRNWEYLLVEALHRIDEERATMETLEFEVDKLLPEADETLDIQKETAIPSLKEGNKDVVKILRELKEETDEIKNAVVIDDKGNINGALVVENAKEISRMMLNILRFGKNTDIQLDLGAMDETIIFCENSITLLFPIQKNGIFGVTAATSNIGMLRWNCKEAADRINQMASE